MTARAGWPAGSTAKAEAADSFEELIVAVDAIGGAHETDDQVAGFVRRVLGGRE